MTPVWNPKAINYDKGTWRTKQGTTTGHLGAWVWTTREAWMILQERTT